MIRHLGETLDEFPGLANQTRCFVHTVNLIAKSILSPFDAWKMKDRSEFNDVAQALADSGPPKDMTWRKSTQVMRRWTLKRT
jgi:hypothetical protein